MPTRASHAVALTRAAALMLAISGLAVTAVAAVPAGNTVVQLERVRPHREQYPTLRFLKENRDFIRARFDLLREKQVIRPGRAEPIDPRYLTYSSMLAGIQAAGDSVSNAARTRTGLDVLASITQLGQLEAELDLMDRHLARQRERLGMLQADFTGHQQTELVVVLSGYPSTEPIDTVAITLEDGSPLSMPIAPEQRELLRTGGVVQVFHGFVEPREQVVALRITGQRWPAGDSAFVRLFAPRDRKTMLRLHLAPVDARGAVSIAATTWLHDEQLGTREQ